MLMMRVVIHHRVLFVFIYISFGTGTEHSLPKQTIFKHSTRRTYHFQCLIKIKAKKMVTPVAQQCRKGELVQKVLQQTLISRETFRAHRYVVELLKLCIEFFRLLIPFLV
jgi:hypothetical protein